MVVKRHGGGGISPLCVLFKSLGGLSNQFVITLVAQTSVVPQVCK